VALVISALVEHLEYCSQQSKIRNSSVVIKTGVSEDYFIQIAKLRAIRRLWKLIAKEYGIKNDIHLIVETSLTDKSISDSYNNLIRTTVEAMAAVAGGCNELIVTEFDTLFSTNKNLAERMAVNQQLILKEESYLNKMADIACGSFYLENITDAIATEALQTFKRFENEGGFLNCLDKNIFFNEIATQAKHYEEFIATKKQIVIGVNKFKNEKENISISDTQLNVLQQLPINNPVLNFELENYFTKK
jgi:methylmalonyl-CoA mutase